MEGRHGYKCGQRKKDKRKRKDNYNTSTKIHSAVRSATNIKNKIKQIIVMKGINTLKNILKIQNDAALLMTQSTTFKRLVLFDAITFTIDERSKVGCTNYYQIFTY